MMTRICFLRFAFLAFLSLSVSAEAGHVSHRILFFGDSHMVGPFGHTLDQLLRTIPRTSVETYAVCGSVARDFLVPSSTKCGYFYRNSLGQTQEGLQANAPDIVAQMNAFQPDIVVIELDSNYSLNWTDAEMQADMQALLHEVLARGIKLVWISMPDIRKYRSTERHIVDLTWNLLPNNSLWIDSLLLTHYPDTGGDGVHYSTPELAPEAQAWARTSFQRIRNYFKI